MEIKEKFNKASKTRQKRLQSTAELSIEKFTKKVSYINVSYLIDVVDPEIVQHGKDVREIGRPHPTGGLPPLGGHLGQTYSIFAVPEGLEVLGDARRPNRVKDRLLHLVTGVEGFKVLRPIENLGGK